ncbi:putative periplasmic serine endoprotease DegP-like precursor [Rubripirellula amarantea]|uniref:Putative periplasmic serine endoprotease DegP-like n=1 Tax=Rubripirellula amarantea TaxID=2527999 RepID=A0A5C5WUE1_9BACT|nr:Do family serine endopeptidase [Rubripirellula amarantea]TWT54160.1 putative periplasmic serine endoprotease DegP-like precursor [Rubripirellula amarantea]
MSKMRSPFTQVTVTPASLNSHVLPATPASLIRVLMPQIMVTLLLASQIFSDNLTLAQDAFPNRTAAQAGGGTANVAPGSLIAADALSNAFRQVAESMRPSVVAITTKSVQQVQPSFEDFFGRTRRPRQRESEGTGSGVIVRQDGFILTNNHVVEGADDVKVELSDGTTLPGEVVGLDPQTDLAVVKVDRTGLRPAPFGSSDDIRVGDWVLAIGSPFGLDQTVTAGIISGKNRVQRIINDGDGFEDFLQTDAAINPGNSGGPLVNLRGELVGINTAILSRSGGSAGIGFAIPVSIALPVLDSIIETGEVKRGFLGASVVDVTPKAVSEYDLKVKRGGLIGGVLEGQPAALAGLQPGDVVVSTDGKPVIGGTQLRNYIASRRPGSTIKMDVNRNGVMSQVEVQLKERTDEAMAMFLPNRETSFGARLVPVTPETAAQFGYEGLSSGLIVTSIDDGGVADRMELQVGDVIESVAGVPMKSPEQFGAIASEASRLGRAVRMIVRRGNQRLLFVPSDE